MAVGQCVVTLTLRRCDGCPWEQDDPDGTKLAIHKQRRHTSTVEAVTALITADPSHAEDVQTVIDAIEMVARDNDGQVDPNAVRRLLPAHVHPQTIGAVYNQLTSRGRLERIGWTTNEDRAGRNYGKPLALYELREAS